jgi:hypothetical protein
MMFQRMFPPGRSQAPANRQGEIHKPIAGDVVPTSVPARWITSVEKIPLGRQNPKEALGEGFS